MKQCFNKLGSLFFSHFNVFFYLVSFMSVFSPEANPALSDRNGAKWGGGNHRFTKASTSYHLYSKFSYCILLTPTYHLVIGPYYLQSDILKSTSDKQGCCFYTLTAKLSSCQNNKVHAMGQLALSIVFSNVNS